jgi:hypothetical protein
MKSKRLNKTRKKKIITLLNQYQVTFGELFLWLKLFE